MEEVLMRLIDIVQDISPEVWEIAMKQVQVMAIQNYLFLGLGILALVSSVCVIVWGVPKLIDASNSSRYGAEERYFWTVFIAALFSFVVALWVILLVNNAISYAVNPEYQAVKALLYLVK